MRLKRWHFGTVIGLLLMLPALIGAVPAGGTSTTAVDTPDWAVHELVELAASALTDDLPNSFRGDSGRVSVIEGHEVPHEVITQWGGRLPLGARLTKIGTDGDYYHVTSLLDGGPNGLVIVNQVAPVSDPADLRAWTVVAARYVEAGDEVLATAVVVDSQGNLADVRSIQSSPAAMEADECNCGLAQTALVTYIGTCGTVAAFSGPLLPAVTIWCLVSSAVITIATDNYCDACEESGEVTVSPNPANGWQDTSHPQTQWFIQYNPPHGPNLRVEMFWRTTLTYGTPPHNATNYVAEFYAQHDCCKTQTAVYDVEGWVRWETGEYGVGYGKWVVQGYGSARQMPVPPCVPLVCV